MNRDAIDFHNGSVPRLFRKLLLPTLLVFLRGLVFLLPSFLLLPGLLGVPGIWLAMPLAEVATLAVVGGMVMGRR